MWKKWTANRLTQIPSWHFLGFHTARSVSAPKVQSLRLKYVREMLPRVWTWNRADVLPSEISSEIISLHKVTFSVHLRVIKRNKLPNRRNMLLALPSPSYSRSLLLLLPSEKINEGNRRFIDKMLLNESFMVETRSFSFFQMVPWVQSHLSVDNSTTVG